MNEEVTVSISDIHVLKQAIEVASRRGAFHASEMEAVGSAYSKIAQWLDTVMSEEQDQANSEGETDA